MLAETGDAGALRETMYFDSGEAPAERLHGKAPEAERGPPAKREERSVRPMSRHSAFTCLSSKDGQCVACTEIAAAERGK